MVGLLTKVAANKEVESSSKDHNSIVEAATSKKKISTTTKI